MSSVGKRTGAGRPLDSRKDHWTEHLGLTLRQRRDLTQRLLDQLDRCADDDARRVLMHSGNSSGRKHSLQRIGLKRADVAHHAHRESRNCKVWPPTCEVCGRFIPLWQRTA